MLNLELKVRDGDPAATLASCRRLGASDAGSLHQRDTYFATETGKLKLRQDLGNGEAELIGYRRPHEDGIRASVYERMPVTDPERLLAVLGQGLGVAGVVEKRRRLFLHEHVRIHLDDVSGLGHFVELEAVYAGRAAPPVHDAALQAVIEALGLGSREPVAGGYLDLLRH